MYQIRKYIYDGGKLFKLNGLRRALRENLNSIGFTDNCMDVSVGDGTAPCADRITYAGNLYVKIAECKWEEVNKEIDKAPLLPTDIAWEASN